MTTTKRVPLRFAPLEQFLIEWPCYSADMSVITLGSRAVDWAKYRAAEEWVLENIPLDSVYRFGVTFYFKNKKDQIDFLLRYG